MKIPLSGWRERVAGFSEDGAASFPENRKIEKIRMMKRWLLFLALAGGMQVASAAGRAGEILEGLAAGFRAMKGYEVDFAVEAGEYRTAGSYAVEGQGYFLTLGDAEVFCDGTVRYEVDHARREVTIVEVDTTSRNILNNPVRAFDFLDSEYLPELLSETEGRAVVRLTPTAENSSPAGTVTVTVSTAAMRPECLDYDYEGERVRITIGRVAPLGEPLRAFDRKRCEGYEFIDFR